LKIFPMNAKRNKSKNSLSPELLAVISGIFWAAAFPPLPMGFLAFIMLAILWFALQQVKSGFRAAKIGYLWGFTASLGTLWWIVIPTIPGMVILILFLPLFSALYAWMHHRIARKRPVLAVILSPILLLAIEFLRSWGKLGFPWLNLSYTMTDYCVLIQFADIVGNFGVSFWVAAINSCIYFILYRPLSKSFWIAVVLLALLFGGSFIYGKVKIQQNIEGEYLKIALLQGNVDPYKKWTKEFKRRNAKLYGDMIHSVEGEVNLIIMPETATACYHRVKHSMFNPLVDAVEDVRIPTLMGSIDFEEDDRKRYYNCAILVMPDRSYEQFYAKFQLVPFSEYIPLQDKFTSLRKLNFGGSHFASGTDFTIFEFDDYKFSVTICYEAVFGWLGRIFHNQGAHFFVNITNDGWFGKTSGPYQHAMFNVMRAIENRVWIARCANTGISMFIDPFGRINRQTRLFERCILIGEIYTTDIVTLYNKFGDVFGWGSFILAPFLVWFLRK